MFKWLKRFKEKNFFPDGQRGLNFEEIRWLTANRDIPESIGYIFEQLKGDLCDLEDEDYEERIRRHAVIDAAKREILFRVKSCLGGIDPYKGQKDGK